MERLIVSQITQFYLFTVTACGFFSSVDVNLVNTRKEI